MVMGVVAALEAEARALGPGVRRRDGLICVGGNGLLAVSGMGGVRAGIAAHKLVDAGARRLVSFGLAGGLDPALKAGAVILPDCLGSAAGRRLGTLTAWCEQVRGALAHPPCRGLLLSTDAPIATPAGKAAAFRETGAVAADMESLGVADAAAARGLPFIAVRVIVDTAGDELPAAVTAANRDGQVSLARLMGGLAAAPWDLVAIIRLAQRYRTAARSLESAARAGLLPAMAAAVRVA